MGDIVQAIIEILKADATVASLAGDRVFGDGLPAAETAHMPRAAIVVRASGGISVAAGTNSRHDTQRVDVLYYGKTRFLASELQRIGRNGLGDVRRKIVSGCLIHWIEAAGGLSTGLDPEGKWPISFQSYQAFFAEHA
ncbi:hypothetical protein [Pelagibacterium halotolerans]|uniref:Uncharacterized protein n=1 Tax=Pelagibacterium halotolerans (strain DSM 22347 / JCM 15775 / CGMCC 1.7692 / B2) TaxID=1082931 RepID=G4RDC5_PELHB|nr:hypothetical protein [Pelagibacterium halotolerans]AEQ50751.1 hypothetical protein KKY_712 [Pelagibacterium halotolerans B2]QJR19329.1 DUF3168 domain-containing protein [Pelagibacterium halotolerans]SDZ94846.1 hypothetical protein SAMN05428936_101638 [Pelagibacterium halotolerans]